MEKVTNEADAWKETSEEQTLRLAGVKGNPMPLTITDRGVNASYEVEFDGVGRAVFKPKSGEVLCRKSISPGTHYVREAAAFRLDRVCGFNLVPLTVIRDVGGEIGSVQLWVVIDGWDSDYSKVDVARMAAFDYIIGNTDRHFFNSRTQESEKRPRPSAIDNGLCLPRDTSEPLRSRWVSRNLNNELPDPVKTEVLRLTPALATAILKPLGVEDAAIEGLLRRLEEVQTYGVISGKAWGGAIKAI